VQPAAGVIGANSSIEISIHYVGPGSSMSASSQVSRGQPNWWRDDKKAKVVVMVVTVSGLLNTKSEQHRLCVCKGTTAAASSLQQASQVVQLHFMIPSLVSWICLPVQLDVDLGFRV